jgi:hypothetical protein
MNNEKQQTAVDWLVEELLNGKSLMPSIIEQAKQMEKEQKHYTKADVIKAGEMGEINYLDTLHIVTYLDEAKKYNETYGGNK